MAEYIFDKYGERTRLITADPGGYQAIEHLVEADIVETLPVDAVSQVSPRSTVEVKSGMVA